MIFDTHAHYDDHQFDEDREKILKGLAEEGVGTVVNVAAELESIPVILQMIDRYDFLYGAAGVHPDNVEALNEKTIEIVENALNHKKILAVGEIGLDYHYEGYDKELQKHWFKVQLDIARENGLPVIIHSRDAAADTMDLMKSCKAEEIGGVVHCYSYSPEMAEDFVKMGYYIGIGGVLTFKNAKKLKEVAKVIPIEKIVLETDCPYMAPVPFRGQRNYSAYIRYVAQTLAEIKSLSVEEVIAITENNARLLYRL